MNWKGQEEKMLRSIILLCDLEMWLRVDVVGDGNVTLSSSSC